VVSRAYTPCVLVDCDTEAFRPVLFYLDLFLIIHHGFYGVHISNMLHTMECVQHDTVVINRWSGSPNVDFYVRIISYRINILTWRLALCMSLISCERNDGYLLGFKVDSTAPVTRYRQHNKQTKTKN
jgi:hypothetical protein